jgi:hypothetical protein
VKLGNHSKQFFHSAALRLTGHIEVVPGTFELNDVRGTVSEAEEVKRGSGERWTFLDRDEAFMIRQDVTHDWLASRFELLGGNVFRQGSD